MYPVRDFFAPFVLDDFSPVFDTFAGRKATSPRCNVIESAEAYTIELAAPGMNKTDLQVNLSDEGNLIIKMEHRQAEVEKTAKTHYLRREFVAANFSETYILPEDVDKAAISATMTDGILTVTLPKLQPVKEKLARQISIG